MSEFISEVGTTSSEKEPKKVETVEVHEKDGMIFEGLFALPDYTENEIDWVYFGVGGPA